MIKQEHFRKSQYKFLLSFIFVSFSFIAFAQFPNNLPNPTSSGGGGAPTYNDNEYEGPPRDSAFQYFLLEDLNTLYELTDSSVDNLHQYDPIMGQSPFDYIHYGDMGSVHKAFAYQPLVRKGVDLGYHNYDLYFLKPADIKYYNNQIPFADLHYSQATGQDDFKVITDFSVRLAKRLQFSVHHRTINYSGIYSSMQAKHRNNAVNLWYTSENKRYKVFGSWLLNNIRNKNNGGITAADQLETGQFSSRSGVSVNLTTAQLGHKQNEFSLTQFFYLNQKKITTDSTGTKQEADKKGAEFVLSHQLKYRKETYKFFDTAPAADSSFYGDFQVNDNGLRNLVQYDQVNNVFKLGLFYKGNLNVGLDHSVYFLHQEPQDTILNNLFLIGNWKLDLDNDFLGLNIKAHYGLIDNGGDYALDANAFFDFGKFGRLDGRLLSQRYQPNLLQYRLYISKDLFWQNNFNKTQETSISAAYSVPKLGFSANVQYHLIDNLIYYDSTALPVQHDPVVNVFQLFVHQNFQLWRIHLDNKIMLQSVTDNILRFPRVASQHTFYYQGFLFKRKMRAKFGLIARYNASYFGDNFHPVTGQLYQQNQLLTGRFYEPDKEQYLNLPIPIVDFFFNFSVKEFRFFGKIENLNHLALQDVYFVAPLYPLRDWSYRFGVSWQFLD